MRHEAVFLLYPNCNSYDDEYGAFDHNQNPIELDETLIQAKVLELEADYNSKQYQRDRAAAYPPWQDQLDNIFHNGIDAWKADIQVIKDQFPKP